MPAPVPTVGRIVLVPIEHYRYHEREIEIIPAIVTHVHNDTCVSVVGFSAFGNIAVTVLNSLIYSQNEHRLGSWHWMPFQLQNVQPQAVGQQVVNADLHKIRALLLNFGMLPPSSIDQDGAVDGVRMLIDKLKNASPA